MPSLLPGQAPARLVGPIVRVLIALHVTPFWITTAGLIGNIAAAALVATGSLLSGGIVMLIASALDMLDGSVARATGTASRFGALYDSVLDRVSEVLILLAIIAYALDRDDDQQVLLAGVVLAASLLVSYVRARAEGLGLALREGFFRRQERVILLGAGLVFGLLTPVLWLIAVLSALTVVQRSALAGRALLAEDD